MVNNSSRLTSAHRLVIKIGSALLIDSASGLVRSGWLEALVNDVIAARQRGSEVVLVSSGAIALGRRKLGLPTGELVLEQKQAAAAVGQIALAQAWSQAFAAFDTVTAQVLVTLTDTESRRRYLNARATLTTLLSHHVIPVINENDTVATDEIRYGDNDRLAARVASMIGADCLLLLSDIDGLYSAPPNTAGAEFINEVNEITPAIEAMAGKPVSGLGTGGMVTKIDAAKIAVAAGCHMVIASGQAPQPLQRVINGERCTWFVAKASPNQARKRWIGGTLVPTGKLIVDAGASRALMQGNSLLPAGLIAVEGRFAKGDAVAVHEAGGGEIARGLVAYDASEAARLIKCKSQDIANILGYRGRDELIHRDDMVVTGQSKVTL